MTRGAGRGEQGGGEGASGRMADPWEEGLELNVER